MTFRARLLHCLAASTFAVFLGLSAAASGQTTNDRPETIRSPRIQDVTLTTDGIFGGRVYDRQGQLVSDATVTLRLRNNVLRTRTDDRGCFRVEGLRGGLYRLNAMGQDSLIRLWSPGTAPPTASAEAVVIAGTTVRGQYEVGADYSSGGGHYDGALLQALSKPWLIAGLTAAGIAIPLAVDNDDAS